MAYCSRSITMNFSKAQSSKLPLCRPAAQGKQNERNFVRKQFVRKAFLIALAWVCSYWCVGAATILVSSTADDGPGTLRDALDVANDGDVIAFSVTGTITLASHGIFGTELLVSRSVTIAGPGADQLAIDGNRIGRVFLVSATNAILAGLTITNGFAVSAPSDPFGGNGAGIQHTYGALVISNCSIGGNQSLNLGSFGAEGGGIANDGSYGGRASLLLVNCTVSDNGAESGGGIANDGFFGSADVEIRNSTVSGNRSTGRGGGICNRGEQGSANVRIQNSTIAANSADEGGGICSAGVFGTANVLIVNSTVSRNQAFSQFSGGGAIATFNSRVVIANSTVSENVTFLTDGGGAILISGPASPVPGRADLTIVSSTLAFNAPSGITLATWFGGNPSLEIGNTILDGQPNIQNTGGTVISDGYNLASDDGGGFLTAMSDQVNTDPLLGPLQDNGGPTFTHELLCGSPAIDHGKRDMVPDLVTGIDQRGFPRPSDDPCAPNGPGSDGTDVGAFEVETTCACLPTDPLQAVASLIGAINTEWTQPQQLRATLEAALASLQRNKPIPGIHQLQAFQEQLRSQVAPSEPVLAASLIGAAQEIIRRLGH
ncbi:MAG: hypothetical protein C5B50_15620 [Verrucomicrobia bacterium]|nr:MAG: hypothetical protein C5B50_15620 [Verrucomicrobiota bacterium]